MSAEKVPFLTSLFFPVQLICFLSMLLLTVEGHSIYIRNLPLSVTVSQLEAEFQKFGAIKQNGVQVRSNKVCFTFYYSIAFFDLNITLILTLCVLSQQQGFCFGFVEFQEFSSMQSAIKVCDLQIIFFSCLSFFFPCLVITLFQTQNYILSDKKKEL